MKAIIIGNLEGRTNTSSPSSLSAGDFAFSSTKKIDTLRRECPQAF